MNSLKCRLLFGIVAGVAAALAIGIVVVFFTMQSRLYAELDQNLIHRTESMIAMIEEEAGVIELDWIEYGSLPPGFQSGIDYYRVENNQTKEILDQSFGLGDWEMLEIPNAGREPELNEVILPGYREGRSATIVFNARIDLDGDDSSSENNRNSDHVSETLEGTELRLFIASVDTVEPMLSAMQNFFVGLWIICILLTALAVWLVVQRNLQPLHALRTQIEQLDEKVSGQRIAVSKLPLELEPVTQELNLLLERVEKTLIRERTLTSNVAHELRTPIAGILSILEVTLSRLRSTEEYIESTHECFEIAKRMHWLVMNLLSLARVESKNVQLQSSKVNLKRSLQEWWLPFADPAENRGLDVSWEIDSSATLQTDPEFLRVVVTNLFDNAISYTPKGGTIQVVVDSRGNISVANKTVELDSSITERVFDTFWRHSESRGGNENHAGIGLSLCRKIIELLGGKISAIVEESEMMFVINIEMTRR